MSLLNFEVSVIALIDYSGSIMDDKENVKGLNPFSFPSPHLQCLATSQIV